MVSGEEVDENTCVVEVVDRTGASTCTSGIATDEDLSICGISREFGGRGAVVDGGTRIHKDCRDNEGDDGEELEHLVSFVDESDEVVVVGDSAAGLSDDC